MAEKKEHKVILVDDDKFLLDMYSTKFKSAGVKTIPVESGEDLIKKLKEGADADLILLDMIIPGLDGLATLERIQSEKLAEGVKIVMLTNQSDSEEMGKAKALGAIDYIIKATATPSEVVDRVKEILNS